MDKQMLKAMIALLVKEYGATMVYNEALLQLQVERVAYLAQLMAGSDKINRIRIARKMGFAGGLKEAKCWVEKHMSGVGN